MNDTDPPLPVTDVVDFYARWPELRPRILAIAKGETITHSDVDILNWLITVVDMVGPADLDDKV